MAALLDLIEKPLVTPEEALTVISAYILIRTGKQVYPQPREQEQHLVIKAYHAAVEWIRSNKEHLVAA